MRNLLSGLACVIAALALSACGGGASGDAAAGGSSGGNGSTGASTAGTVQVGANVPDAAARAIVSILSTTGTQVQGTTTLAVSGVPSGQTALVLATNANHDLLLAGTYDSSGGSLDVDSTSVFLATLALGGPDALNLTRTQTAAAIQAADGYGALASAVMQALAAPDNAPLQSPAVIAAAAAVAGQVAQSPAAQQARSASALPPTSPAPHRLLDNGYSERIWVTEGGGLALWNQTQLAWAARAASVDNAQVFGNATLQPFTPSLAGANHATLPGSEMEGATSVPLSAPGSGLFVVTVGQDAGTRQQNIIDLEFETLWLTGDASYVTLGQTAAGKQCVNGGLQSVLATLLPEAATSQGRLKADVLTRVPGAFPAFVRQVKTCGSLLWMLSDSQLVTYMSTMYPLMHALLDFNWPLAFFPLGALGSQFTDATKYWNAPLQVTLCATPGVPLSACLGPLNPSDPVFPVPPPSQ